MRHPWFPKDRAMTQLSTTSILAVALVVAAVISLWLSDTVTVFTQFGGLEIMDVQASKGENSFQITIQCINTGVLDVTVEAVYLNGVAQTVQGIPGTLSPDQDLTLELQVMIQEPFVSGAEVHVVVRASDHLLHSKRITLP